MQLVSPFLTCKVGEKHFTNKDRRDRVMLWCQECWFDESFVKGLVNALASGFGEESADAAAIPECLLAKVAA